MCHNILIYAIKLSFEKYERIIVLFANSACRDSLPSFSVLSKFKPDLFAIKYS